MGGQSSRPRSRPVVERSNTGHERVKQFHNWQYDGITPVSSAGGVFAVLCWLCRLHRGTACAAARTFSNVQTTLRCIPPWAPLPPDYSVGSHRCQEMYKAPDDAGMAVASQDFSGNCAQNILATAVCVLSEARVQEWERSRQKRAAAKVTHPANFQFRSAHGLSSSSTVPSSNQCVDLCFRQTACVSVLITVNHCSLVLVKLQNTQPYFSCRKRKQSWWTTSSAASKPSWGVHRRTLLVTAMMLFAKLWQIDS